MEKILNERRRGKGGKKVGCEINKREIKKTGFGAGLFYD